MCESVTWPHQERGKRCRPRGGGRDLASAVSGPSSDLRDRGVRGQTSFSKLSTRCSVWAPQYRNLSIIIKTACWIQKITTACRAMISYIIDKLEHCSIYTCNR